MTMKRTLIIATLAIMSLFGTTACAQKKGENMNSLNNKKVLVAYFSWSGNTKAAADYIAQKLNADQFEIVREADYPTDYDECANEAKAEKDANTHPAIKGTVSDMAQYDVVLVCVPAGGTLPRCPSSPSWNNTTSAARPSSRSARLTPQNMRPSKTSSRPRPRATTATASVSSPKR